MMKMICAVVIAGLLVAGNRARAQLKPDQDGGTNASQSMVQPSSSIGNFLGLLNSDNFMMHHNLSFSYLSFSGGAMSIASYTNSMFYKIADPLNVRVDLTLQGSPFGQNGGFTQSDLNKFFVSRAELNYQLSQNAAFKLEYNNLPLGSYGRYSPYGLSPYFGDK